MSAISDEALELFASGLNFLTEDFSIVYVDTGYAYGPSDNRLDDVDAGARAFTVALTGKTATAGVLDADDPSPQTPTAGRTLRGAWLYHDTGVESTSELLVWWDRTADGAMILTNAALNPTTGDPINLVLPRYINGVLYGLLKL